MNNLLLGFLITVAFWMTPAPQYTKGAAVWYAPGVMEATCEVRGLDLQGYVDGVAMMSPADIGKVVWIKGPLGWEGPFLVCDCGVRGQVWEMVMDRGEVIEVGWRTAARWGLGPHEGGWKLKGVEVFVGDVPPGWHDPLDNYRSPSIGAPIDYVQWFEENVELETCVVKVAGMERFYRQCRR